MSLSADIWEVMAEAISGHDRDPFEAFRGAPRTLVTSGSSGAQAVLEVAERDVGTASTSSGEAVLDNACEHYGVARKEVRNPNVRYTAVTATRVSVATTLAARGWSNVDIAGLLHITQSSVSYMLHGGRGKGVLVSSRVCKELVARRPRPPRQPSPVVKRGPSVRMENAVRTLRHLRACGEESYFSPVLARHFPELAARDVYAAAFGSDPAPLTLDEARAAELRGEGAIKFVGGVPTWQPHLAAPVQEPNHVRAVAP